MSSFAASAEAIRARRGMPTQSRDWGKQEKIMLSCEASMEERTFIVLKGAE